MMMTLMMMIVDDGDDDDAPPALLFRFYNTVSTQLQKRKGAAPPHREVRPRPKIIRQTMSSIRHSATFLRFAVVATRSKCPIVCWDVFTNKKQRKHTTPDGGVRPR